MIQTTFRKRCPNYDDPNLKCAGEMVHTGVVFTTYPAQYCHKCELCGLNDSYSKYYPHTLVTAQRDEKREEWA